MKSFSSRPAGYTIGELSAIVGMSPRNIRAHQTRGLLPPPVRHGRSAYYGPVHLRRLERITTLQEQGFNLASIAAMLGTATADPGTARTSAALAEIARVQPPVFCALERHGLLGRDDSGAAAIARPPVAQAVAELAGAGIPPVDVLRFLGQLMDRMAPVADAVVGAAAERLTVADSPSGGASPDLGSSLADFLVSAFRTAVENAVELTFPGRGPGKRRSR
ncbi:MerR family transcriptional regulator [Amycolatopsis orientalis]|uniref:MerR family transcriptional regulator n=1 Tax=Amycolatopsis orientalis TaxID=31958 RepID=A0A193CCA4_AMYOR|nr:MerR family transcriptional regulator [Amycolatopsis orientalis]ANN21993.1 MerR family transcriptional regulator [Amycolatopsis orientalis]